MSLLDKLLKSDIAKVNEPETAIFHSKKLMRLTGEKKPVPVTVQELPSQRINELIQTQFDKKGRYRAEKASRANALLVAEAVTDPPVKDKELLAHFGAATPADLCEKLFAGEITAIANLVMKLSGYIDEEEESDEDEELKN